MLQPTTIRFLKNLKTNNSKPWFNEHRNEYEAARSDFGAFIQSVIDQYGKTDPSIASLSAKECMFRINRDIRFSKDKTPYKKNFAASINQGGKKSIFGGYYFNLEPGNSFAGGGIWMPMPAETQKIRQEIDYCWDEFKKITGSKKFITTYGGLEKEAAISLTHIPRGYAKDNPAGAYLKLKSWIATRPISDKELTSEKLLQLTVDAFKTIQPLLVFLNRAIE